MRFSQNKYKIIAFYTIAFFFVVFNSWIIIKEENLLFNLFPLALIVFLAMFFALDKVLLFSVFLVPFSVPLKTFIPGLEFNVDLPTEPIFVGILFIFILKQLQDRNFDKKLLKHPVSIALYIYLFWRFVTVFTSTMPIVSLKAFIASLWFIVPFYFLISQLFKDKKKIYNFLWLYIISFIIIIVYTLIKHSASGFTQNTANFIVNPFYNDHTSYGAVLAMFIPVLIGFVVSKDLKKYIRIWSFIILLLFIIAIIFSYTRAAWVSLIVGLGVYIILKLKIKLKYIITAVVIIFGLFFTFQEQIFMSLSGNRQDSSTDFSEHIQSISNITTDASNLERINRWNCAVRMFKEKPVFGWGPGTYQFNYAPFQFSYEKTIVSTNAGDYGNAHSEYLSELSESGLLGMLSFTALIIIIIISGVRSYKKAKSKLIKTLSMSLLIGLITYIAHAFLNNFLDTDKVAVPFWGFVAALVVIELYINSEEEKQNIETEKQ
ncbi:MAG TPA: O-antigen ligase family protein [Bacteroidales bacterium]|nr:O-antigen ligase family protein [Bacteroidales bacterium]HOR60457.1 O-antigen ligase family protein [Bacteroidales bacterium]HPL03595.1 O-antigen ligase family protein [Bacteroidales bacterium]